MTRVWLLALISIGILACASEGQRAEQLYRQGDVRAALEAWRLVPPDHPDHERAQGRLSVVEPEFERTLRRYEKRALFFESEGRLAEALLYYRLALNLDPGRRAMLERAQQLARRLSAEVGAARADLQVALEKAELKEASGHAENLARLDPFDPAVQIEIRQVQAALGSELLKHLESGKRLYAGGYREPAREAFERVLAIEPDHETALGYLSYLKRHEVAAKSTGITTAPETISPEQILAEGHFRAASRAEGAGAPYRAIGEYLAALRVDPEHREARRALRDLRARLAPRVEELYESGKRYFQEEDLQNALRLWRQVLLIDPANTRTSANVERAERMLSRLEEIQTHGS